MTECPKCGMMRLYRKVDSEPAKFCGGCGHSFANEEQTEKRIRELEARAEKAEAELARAREALEGAHVAIRSVHANEWTKEELRGFLEPIEAVLEGKG